MEITSGHLPAEVYVYKGTVTEIEAVPCSGHFIFIFIRSGMVRIAIDGRDVLGTSGEIILAVGREYYQVIHGGKKLFCYIVKIKQEFILETKMFYHFIETFIKKYPLKISPEAYEQKVLVRIMKLLVYYAAIRDRISTFSSQSFQMTLSLLLFQAGWLYNHSESTANTTYSRKEILAMGFLKLLLKHFRNQQSISFYSGVLCVTNGYLNKALREVTGKTVSLCIAEIVVNEAKYLLVRYDQSIESITVYVSGLTDKQGKEYQGYITYNQESGKVGFSFNNPSKSKEEAMPAEAKNTQPAAKSENSASDETKNGKQQKATQEKPDSATEEQQAPARRRGMKM